jgi:hypothetical protein
VTLWLQRVLAGSMPVLPETTATALIIKHSPRHGKLLSPAAVARGAAMSGEAHNPAEIIRNCGTPCSSASGV